MQSDQGAPDRIIKSAFYSAGFMCGKVNDGLKSLLGSELAEPPAVTIRSL